MRYLLLPIVLMTGICHAEESSKELLANMSAEEILLSKSIAYYRGTELQAYYCMAEFPELSDDVAKTFSKFKNLFGERYDNNYKNLMKIIHKKKDPNASLKDHLIRQNEAVKARIGLIVNTEISFEELCNEFANDPQSIMSLAYEMYGK